MKRAVTPLFLECDRSQVITSWVGVVAFIVLILWYVTWLAWHSGLAAEQLHVLPVTVIVGLFLADLVSGAVHWATDTWFDEKLWTRVISIAREHHIHPHHILGYGIRDYLAYSAWPTLLFLGPIGLVLTLATTPSSWVLHGVVVLFVISVCMLFGTYAHRLGHRRSGWAIVRFLQRCHLLIDTCHHNVHHRDNHDIRYCVINGWANYVCDRTGFWRGLEWLIRRLTGAVPRRNDHEWWARCAPWSPRRGRFVIGPAAPQATAPSRRDG